MEKRSCLLIIDLSHQMFCSDFPTELNGRKVMCFLTQLHMKRWFPFLYFIMKVGSSPPLVLIFFPTVNSLNVVVTNTSKWLLLDSVFSFHSLTSIYIFSPFSSTVRNQQRILQQEEMQVCCWQMAIWLT